MMAQRIDYRALPVPDGLDGLRADVGLARLFGLSRTVAAGVVEAGGARLDGAELAKSDRLRAGGWLEVELPAVDTEPSEPPAPVDGLAVVYADEDIVVVDKPVGVAAHGSPGWEGPTVVGGLAAMGIRLSTSGAAERQGIVHRLDAGTTGLMVVAASEAAYTDLKQQFRERTVHKGYHALAQGHPDPSRGTIEAPIDRHPKHDWKFAVVAGGRDSVTHYDTLEAHRAASLLAVTLETGRTHQIRVHLAAIKHPLVGDTAYGADPTLAQRLGLSRQWLHARTLGFRHPGDGRRVEFASEYPADLAAALERVRAQS